MTLGREDGVYEACGTLTATWRISRIPAEAIQGIEVSVLWHTEGKGDEDLRVHHFQRLVESQIRRSGLAGENTLTCELPATPLSYHGRLISVLWCIRLRLFTTGGREIVAEQPFHLVAPGAQAKIAARLGAQPTPTKINLIGADDAGQVPPQPTR